MFDRIMIIDKKNIKIYAVIVALSCVVIALSALLIVLFCTGWISEPQNSDPRAQVTTFSERQSKNENELQQNKQFSNPEPEPRSNIQENYEQAIPVLPNPDYNTNNGEVLESQPSTIN